MATQNMKKILFLITKSNWGGAQRYVYDLATNLDRNKFDVVVALGGNGTLIEMLQNAGVRTIALTAMKNTTSAKQLWRAGQELYRILKTEKVDVFHLNSSVAGLLGTITGRMARVPKIIFTAHGWAFNEDRPLWQRLIIKTLHYLTVMFSTRTIAVSNAVVTQMNWPGAMSRLKVINLGRTIGPIYDRKEAREKIVDFYPELLPYQNDTWLVCIAELHKVKRHLVLIEAFAQSRTNMPPTRLVIIGEGDERTDIETYIKTNQLEESVFLTGTITEAARFLKAFDLFVLASKSESYGYVLAEAGLAGVPVIATNVGGIPDIITHEKTGLLVPADSVAALAIAITRLQANDEERITYAQALTIAMQPRNVAKMTDQTVSLYLAK